MLDKLIHKHLDDMDEIEKNMNDDIETIISSVDIDMLIDNPDEVMSIVSDSIEQLIDEKYAPLSIDNGIMFAKKVESLKRDIKVQDSNDPTLNEGQVNDKRPD